MNLKIDRVFYNYLFIYNGNIYFLGIRFRN